MVAGATTRCHDDQLFMLVYGWQYLVYQLVLLLLYEESITINPVTSTAESAHGVSLYAEIGRPTHAFASSHHPFRSLFADFRRFSPLNCHIDFFSFKFTQNESNFKMLYLIEFLFNKNSNQQDRQQISAQTKPTAQFFNFCNQKNDITFCVNHHSKFMVIYIVEYTYNIQLPSSWSLHNIEHLDFKLSRPDNSKKVYLQACQIFVYSSLVQQILQDSMKIESKIGRQSVEEIAPLVSCHSREELLKILEEWTHKGPEITRMFNVPYKLMILLILVS